MIYIVEYIVVIYCIKNRVKFFRNQTGFCFTVKLKITLFYSLSFVFICFTTPCHSLSLTVTCYHLLSFVVTCRHSSSFVCHSIYHSLSFVVIRCHSLYHSLLLSDAQCTTRLSFYKWSFLTLSTADVTLKICWNKN